MRGGKCGEWGTPFSREVISVSFPPDPVTGDGKWGVKDASVSLGSTDYHKHDSQLISGTRLLQPHANSLGPEGQAHELLRRVLVTFL